MAKGCWQCKGRAGSQLATRRTGCTHVCARPAPPDGPPRARARPWRLLSTCAAMTRSSPPSHPEQQNPGPDCVAPIASLLLLHNSGTRAAARLSGIVTLVSTEVASDIQLPENTPPFFCLGKFSMKKRSGVKFVPEPQPDNDRYRYCIGSGLYS